MDVVVGSIVLMAVLGLALMAGLMLMVNSDHSDQEEELVGRAVRRPVRAAGRPLAGHRH